MAPVKKKSGNVKTPNIRNRISNIRRKKKRNQTKNLRKLKNVSTDNINKFLFDRTVSADTVGNNFTITCDSKVDLSNSTKDNQCILVSSTPLKRRMITFSNTADFIPLITDKSNADNGNNNILEAVKNFHKNVYRNEQLEQPQNCQSKPSDSNDVICIDDDTEVEESKSVIIVKDEGDSDNDDCICINSSQESTSTEIIHSSKFPEEQKHKTLLEVISSHINELQNVQQENIHHTNTVVHQDSTPINEIPNSLFGSNFYNPGPIRTTGLRPIFIDGNNVAMGHANGKLFSVKGLQICIEYFKLRGHEVTAIVPQYRKNFGQSSDTNLLIKLEKEGLVVFTPSRIINGHRVVPYDDRFIVQLAAVHQGIVVSSDNFRDLLAENPFLKETIQKRVLNPTWVKDMIIFPSDPLGRFGPSLDNFLRFPS